MIWFKTMLMLFAIAACGLFASQLNAAGGDMDKGSASQPRTENQAVAPPGGPAMSLASSDIEGETAKNLKGEKLGTVDDLVIGPDGRVQYLILARDGGILKEDRLFAIPWDMVRIGDEAEVVIHLESEKLANAPNFGRDEWPDFDDPGVKNQYSGYFAGSAREGAEKIS